VKRKRGDCNLRQRDWWLRPFYLRLQQFVLVFVFVAVAVAVVFVFVVVVVVVVVGMNEVFYVDFVEDV